MASTESGNALAAFGTALRFWCLHHVATELLNSDYDVDVEWWVTHQELRPVGLPIGYRTDGLYVDSSRRGEEGSFSVMTQSRNQTRWRVEFARNDPSRDLAAYACAAHFLVEIEAALDRRLCGDFAPWQFPS